MSRFPLVPLLCVAAALVVGACATDGEGWGAAPSASEVQLDQGRFALLSLTANRDSVRYAAGVEVAAQFVEFDGPDDDWAMQALDLWLPLPDANGWLDGCRLGATKSEHLNDLYTVPDHRIELLEAGEVVVARDERLELDVHYLPDLQVYLSGTVYSLGNGRLPYVPGRSYLLTGAGEGQVPMFATSVAAPPAMELLVVDGRPTSQVQEIPLPRGRDLLVEWREQDPASVVYLDLYDDTGSASPLLSCVAIDDGRFELPRDALERIRGLYPEAALRLVARRASLTEFQLADFDWAKMVFTVTDTVFLTP